MVAIDQIAHPESFSGNVHVVGLVAHAGINNFVAVKRERPSGGKQNASPGYNGINGLLVLGIGHQNVSSPGIISGLLARCFKRRLVTSGNRPANFRGTRIAGKVLHRLPAGKAAGAIEDHVILPLRHVSPLLKASHTNSGHSLSPHGRCSHLKVGSIGKNSLSSKVPGIPTLLPVPDSYSR